MYFLLIVAIVLFLLVFLVLMPLILRLDNKNRMFQEALRTNNPSLCDNIWVLPKLNVNEWTVGEVAESIMTHYMNIIPEFTLSARKSCYMKLAKETNNLKLCEVIHEGKCYTQLVIDEVKRELSNACIPSINPRGIKESYETCYRREVVPAVISHFESVCEQAPGALLDYCYLAAVDEIEQMTQDLAPARSVRFYESLCGKIHNQGVGETCRFIVSDVLSK